MFVANHYVRVNGTIFVRGELIPEIPEEKIDWLLGSGAISKVALDADSEPTLAAEVEEDITAEIDVSAGVVSDKPKRTRRKK